MRADAGALIHAAVTEGIDVASLYDAISAAARLAPLHLTGAWSLVSTILAARTTAPRRDISPLCATITAVCQGRPVSTAARTRLAAYFDTTAEQAHRCLPDPSLFHEHRWVTPPATVRSTGERVWPTASTLTGLKIHVDAEHPEQVTTLLGVLTPLLRSRELSAKFAPDTQLAIGTAQARKGVTVYLPRVATLTSDAVAIVAAASAHSAGGDLPGDVMVAPGVGLRRDTVVDPGVEVSVRQAITMYSPDSSDRSSAFLRHQLREIAAVMGPGQLGAGGIPGVFDTVDPAHALQSGDPDGPARHALAMMHTLRRLGAGAASWDLAVEAGRRAAAQPGCSPVEVARAAAITAVVGGRRTARPQPPTVVRH